MLGSGGVCVWQGQAREGPGSSGAHTEPASPPSAPSSTRSSSTSSGCTRRRSAAVEALQSQALHATSQQPLRKDKDKKK